MSARSPARQSPLISSLPFFQLRKRRCALKLGRIPVKGFTMASNSNSKHHKIVFVSITNIQPSPENDDLYRPVLDSDPAIQALAESIRENGLREPLVLSLDGYILSGHRRYVACKLAGLKKVPVRYENVRRLTQRDKFLTLLREFNRQRVKSLDEQIRESVIDADPEEARAELREYRREKSKVGHDSLSLGAVKTRKKISAAKTAFQQAIVDVVYERRDYWPLSDRQIHYALLNNPPLKHSGKPDSIYRNDQPSYKSLVELVTRMRIVGTIPFDAIGDETRPFTEWDVHREPGAFVAKEIKDFLMGYSRDLIQSQPNHIEVVVEKNTVAGILRTVCGEFCIPMTSGRGYCSLPPRYKLAERFRFQHPDLGTPAQKPGHDLRFKAHSEGDQEAAGGVFHGGGVVRRSFSDPGRGVRIEKRADGDRSLFFSRRLHAQGSARQGLV